MKFANHRQGSNSPKNGTTAPPFQIAPTQSSALRCIDEKDHHQHHAWNLSPPGYETYNHGDSRTTSIEAMMSSKQYSSSMMMDTRTDKSMTEKRAVGAAPRGGGDGEHNTIDTIFASGDRNKGGQMAGHHMRVSSYDA